MSQLALASITDLVTEPLDRERAVLHVWRDPNHPAHDRWLLNPHAAFYCAEGCVELRTKAARDVLRALSGGRFRTVLN